MHTEAIVERMAAFPASLQALMTGTSPEAARWKPPSGAWSILEIVCHLGDEEVDDFRARLRFVLERREGAWPSIDPEGWARERRYNERELGEAVDRFARERQASLGWLREVVAEDPEWSAAYEHPRFGPIRAGDLLASWAAHDALHLRQIAKRMHELASVDAPGFDTRYAGEWRA